MTPTRTRPLPGKPGFLGAAQPALALFLGGLALLALAGCGGGSSSSQADALALPSRIELTRVQDTAPGQIVAAAYAAPGTDYSNQTKEYWVKDTEILDLVNGILGALNESGYQFFVNQGPYQALVTPVDDGPQEGGATTERLMDMIVEVTRANNTSPMIVKIWVTETEGPLEYHCLIRGHFVVSQGVSAEYPFGVMDAHFAAMPLDENGEEITGSNPRFTLALSISAQDGQVSIQLYDAGDEEYEGQPYLWLLRSNILASNDLSEGGAWITESETRQGATTESSSRFAFNQDYLKFQEVGEDVVVQDKNVQVRKVHRYRVFNGTTGAALPLRSGFPISFSGGQHGHVGFHGLWAPNNVTITNGMQVTRTSSGQPYRLIRVDGRLSKHTKVDAVLGDLTGLEISVHGGSESDKIVVWNGTTFMHVANRSWSGGMTFVDPAVEHTFGDPFEGGWVEALRAWVRLGHLTPDNSDAIQYHTDEPVTPTVASDLTLYYWGFALDLPITQSLIDGAAVAEAAYFGGSMTQKTFFFDASSLLLKKTNASGLPVLLPTGLNLNGTRYAHGYQVGPLTTLDTYTEHDCWDIYESETFYQWVTGPNEWSRFTGLETLQGVPVVFDAPLRFRYIHSTANDLNSVATYDGRPFTLEYDGHYLHVPGRYDPATDEWEPMINLKDGTLLGSEPAYVVKATAEEVRLGVVTDAAILTELETTLPFDLTIPAPTLVYDPARTALVGPRPTGVALRVIKGDLVTATP